MIADSLEVAAGALGDLAGEWAEVAFNVVIMALPVAALVFGSWWLIRLWKSV